MFKEIGSLNFFLVMEVIHIPSGLLQPQKQYILSVIFHYASQYYKIPFLDPTKFCQIVGALICVAFTQPDLAFSVNKVWQFMHNPNESHEQFPMTHMLHDTIVFNPCIQLIITRHVRGLIEIQSTKLNKLNLKTQYITLK